MATKLFAVRLGEFDIPVFEVRPGVICTYMTATVKEKSDKLIEEGLCVHLAHCIMALIKDAFTV